MNVTETYGKYVEQLSESKPETARKLLKTGWQAQNLKNKHFPDKRLLPADQYLARFMMDRMLAPLKEPENSAIVSIFTPCELIQATGLSPYNVEGFSAYLNGSHAEQAFLRQAEQSGLSETLCSYHKTFIGAAQKGLLPRPKCIVYTNLTCDANLLTFRYLAELYDVPSFFIDVPVTVSEDSVQYVADQMRQLHLFLEKETGRKIRQEDLVERVRCSQRTKENYQQFQRKRADKYIPTDLATPLYGAITNNVLLGTKEQETYTRMLLDAVEQAESKKGLHIYWMHTIPFWSEAMKAKLCFSSV